MTSPAARPSGTFAPLIGLAVCVAALFALIHLAAYYKRESARAEAYRATILQAALGGTPEAFLRYQEARK